MRERDRDRASEREREREKSECHIVTIFSDFTQEINPPLPCSEGSTLS